MAWEIQCQDAVQWLKSRDDRSIDHVVTGLPDVHEIDSTESMTFADYHAWFTQVARDIFRTVKPKGYAIFIQTDRKRDRQVYSKSTWLTSTAMESGMKLIWHKIVLQRDVGKIDLYRPTYSHMLCYSREGSTGVAFEDVIPPSKKYYANATPIEAVERAIRFISTMVPKTARKADVSIVDPFVGRGTVGQIAYKYGFNFLGIDIDMEQCQASVKLLSNHPGVEEPCEGTAEGVD